MLIGAFSLIRFLPNPVGLPEYARFLPADPVEFSPQQVAGREPGAEASATAIVTVAATSTIPSTVAGIATIKVESANCRAKPRGNAERITFLYKNQQVEIVGRNDDLGNPWWYIKIPDSNDNCWLWGMTAKMTGTVEEIPIVK